MEQRTMISLPRVRHNIAVAGSVVVLSLGALVAAGSAYRPGSAIRPTARPVDSIQRMAVRTKVSRPVWRLILSNSLGLNCKRWPNLKEVRQARVFRRRCARIARYGPLKWLL
jgi:hypothetical protein